MAAKKKRKNSLVENINRRKRGGTSRPKSRSTVSPGAYDAMQQGWPSKKGKARKKTARAKTGGKKPTRAKAGANAKKTARSKKKAGKTSSQRASHA